MRPLLTFNRLGAASQLAKSVVGLDFAVAAGAPDYAGCKFGNGIQIDNDAEVVSSLLTPAGYTYTVGCVEMWVKIPYNVDDGKPQDGNAHYVWRWEDPIDNLHYQGVFWHNTLGLYWAMRNGGTWTHWEVILGGYDISAGVVTHVGFSWDIDAAKKRIVYIDGAEIGSTNTLEPNQDMTAAKMTLGNSATTPGNDFNGIIDNFKWHNYQKTDFSDRFNERGGLNDQVIAV